MPVYTSRAAKMLALVPKFPNDSGEEDDDDMSDEEMMRRLNNIFEIVPDQEQDDAMPEDVVVDLAQVEAVDQVDSDGPVEEELQDMERSAEEGEAVWEATDLIVLPANDDIESDREMTSDMPGLTTVDPDVPSATAQAHSTFKNGLSIPTHNRKKAKFCKVKPLKKSTVKTGKNQKKKISRKKKKTFKWKKTSLRSCVDLPEHVPTKNMLDEAIPIRYFKRFFTDELLQMIVEESNRYSVQQKGTSSQISANELRDFLAIEITMGIVKIRSWKSYWAQETKVDRVTKVMSRNKYAKIRSSLHFVNNDDPMNDPDDRYIKIRPVAEYLRQKFINIEGIDRKFSIDEMMIGYKGKKAGSRRQYMPKKPTKWGFKVFARCGVSGIVYDFFFYAGENSFLHVPFNRKEHDDNFSSKCVLALCKSIKDPALAAVFFDNFFSSPRLISMLRYEYGILSLGTLRANRLDGAENFIAQDKELLKRGRGSFDVVSDNKKKITIVKWADTKVVTLGSSYVGVEPVGAVTRWSVVERKRASVPCPKIVKEYNSFMGGVDKADMLTSLYKTPLRTFKWYMAIFAHLLDLSLSNAWLLYKLENPESKMSLVDFKISISNALTVHKKMKRSNSAAVSPNPCPEQRLEGAQHLPVSHTKGKCRLCHSHQTIWSCSQCNVRLCVTPQRNCFQNYHTVREIPKRKYTWKKKSDEGKSDREQEMEEESKNVEE